MNKVSDIVTELIQASDIELEAMRDGILNLSAYAAQIQPEVEKRAWNNVKKATIVVALSRLQQKIAEVPPLRPTIHVDELSVQSPLADVTYECTRQSLEQSRSLSAFLAQEHPQFFTQTQGVDELTIIVSQEQLEVVLAYFDAKPKAVFRDLVGVSLRFSDRYLSEPNVIYTILAALAGQRINLIEVISTYTELTVVIEQRSLELAIQTLNRFFQKSQIKTEQK